MPALNKKQFNKINESVKLMKESNSLVEKRITEVLKIVSNCVHSNKCDKYVEIFTKSSFFYWTYEIDDYGNCGLINHWFTNDSEEGIPFIAPGELIPDFLENINQKNRNTFPLLSKNTNTKRYLFPKKWLTTSNKEIRKEVRNLIKNRIKASDLKNQALAKLTKEEKNILGLGLLYSHSQ